MTTCTNRRLDWERVYLHGTDEEFAKLDQRWSCCEDDAPGSFDVLNTFIEPACENPCSAMTGVLS